MHGPLRHWCQCKGERFVRVEGGRGSASGLLLGLQVKIWARSVAGVWMRRLIIAFGCKRKDGCQCDGRMSYPHRGTKKAVHLKAMLALPFKFGCPPKDSAFGGTFLAALPTLPRMDYKDDLCSFLVRPRPRQ